MPQPIRTLSHVRTRAPDATQLQRFVKIAEYDDFDLEIYFDVATGHVWTELKALGLYVWLVSSEAFTVDGAGGLVNGRFQ